MQIASQDKYVYVCARTPDWRAAWAWQMKPDYPAWAVQLRADALARHDDEDCALGIMDEVLRDLAMLALSNYELVFPTFSKAWSL